MTISNEEPKKSPEIKQKTYKDPRVNSQQPLASKKPFITAGIGIIAITALGVSLYSLSLDHQLQSQLAEKNTQLNKQLEEFKQNQNNTQAQVTIKTQAIEQTRAKLESQFAELNKQLQNAMNQRFYQNQNWILLKARYYLELAQINAHWSKSYSATIALLHQADQLLFQLKDPKIFDIRQAIAKDTAQLKAIPILDVAGILSQLDAAQHSLKDLNITSTLSDYNSKPTKTPSTEPNQNSIWRLRLQDSMSLLSKLIVIRRNDTNIQPLLSPAFEAMLKENIRLNLQEAQWAVLNHNAQVYQLVLNQALSLLKQNFNENAQNTTALIQKIIDLQRIQLNQKKPVIGLALPLLNQLIETKESEVKPAEPDHEKQGESQ